jgi:tRNA-specific 2-thiouridylase
VPIDIPEFCKIEDFPKKGSSVVVGVSGGVDSAVASAILSDYGCNVECVFLKLYPFDVSAEAEADARKVAEFLDLKITVIDHRQKFEDKVIRPFVTDYCSGRTPIPCARCNQYVKFEDLEKFALEQNIDFIATGHYVRKKKEMNIFSVYSAENKSRDQSYFLYGISSSQIEKAVFPLGNAPSKQSVRQYAEKRGIPVAKKSDSQDVCFLPDEDYVSFIKGYIEEKPEYSDLSVKPGKILTKDGRELGIHDGAVKYTVGQRHGLGISSRNPLYVLKIEKENVFVGERESLFTKKIYVNDINFHCVSAVLFKDLSKRNVPLLVQFRSTTPAVDAVCSFEGNNCMVEFKDPQCGVAPGQSAVMRLPDSTIVCGGVIASEGNLVVNEASPLPLA